MCRDYWRAQLAGAPEALQLPTRGPRPSAPTYESGTLTVQLPEGLLGRVGAAAAGLGVNTQALLLASLQVGGGPALRCWLRCWLRCCLRCLSAWGKEVASPLELLMILTPCLSHSPTTPTTTQTPTFTPPLSRHPHPQAVLCRFSGQDEVVVGVPVAGRDRMETHGTMGYFINTLPLRGGLAEGASVGAMAAAAGQAMADALAHSLLPLADVVAAAGARRTPGVNPLFQVLLQYLPDAESVALSLAGVREVALCQVRAGGVVRKLGICPRLESGQACA